ncbi:MAG: sulfatase-like hydrolase/transferase [Marinicella sp.]
MITGTIKNNLLLIFLALLAGYWHAQEKVNGSINLKIGLTIETKAHDKPYQIYCHSFKEYTGANRTDGNYTSELLINEDTYRIVENIKCGPKTTHIRFDPLPGAGEVKINQLRVHGNYWREIPLEDIIQQMKPMNAINKITLQKSYILIQAIGNDPFLQLTDQVQELIKPDQYDKLKYTAKYSVIALLVFKLLAYVLSQLLGHGPKVVYSTQRLNQSFNHHTTRIFKFFHLRMGQSNEVSSILMLLAFVFYLIASWVFARHLVSSSGSLFLFALGFLTLQFLVILATYITVIHALGHVRWLRTLMGFILLLSTLLIAVDASLFSLNGMHVFHGLGMLTHGGIDQFFNNLKFTGLARSELTLYLIAIAVALLFCFSVVWVLDHKTNRFKLRLSIYQALFLTGIAILLTFLLQILASKQLTSGKIATYENHHPIGLSFFDQKGYIVAYPAKAVPFKRLDNPPKQIATMINSNINQVYLFVFESLRENAITPSSAPNLFQFKEDGWYFNKMLASGNASHYGWYSVINASHPFYLERYARLKDKRGSLPIQLFRELGFQINVFSAKDLSYLSSDHVMFGENLSLVDYLSDHPDISPPEHDRKAADEVISKINNSNSSDKQLNIIFFDSTHYPYRWNDQFIESIEPFQGTPAEGTDLSSAVRIMQTDKALIYNRYLNAVKHMDYLFGEVVTALKHKGSMENSLVAVVGDHGQQFMEHGYMLHGFTLFNEDINVPIYFQGPGLPTGQYPQVVAHTDIMPTLLHAVGLDPINFEDLHGQSLLEKEHRPFVLSAVAGEQNTPYSFVLSSNDWKLFFKTESNNPADFKKLYVTMITDNNDAIYVPGDGSEQAYRNFIDQNFQSFIEQMTITSLP